MAVVIIIGILAVLLIPAVQSMSKRGERIKCMGNLRGLYFGANSYVQLYGYWPQIDPANVHRDQYAEEWIATLSQFGIPREAWVCPSIQRLLGSPNLYKTKNVRVDYLSTTFDAKPLSPYRWATQPWFAEKADVHGDGNLMIFSDGSVESLGSVLKHPRRTTN